MVIKLFFVKQLRYAFSVLFGVILHRNYFLCLDQLSFSDIINLFYRRDCIAIFAAAFNDKVYKMSMYLLVNKQFMK